jgi:hypothetical protein
VLDGRGPESAGLADIGDALTGSFAVGVVACGCAGAAWIAGGAISVGGLIAAPAGVTAAGSPLANIPEGDGTLVAETEEPVAGPLPLLGAFAVPWSVFALASGGGSIIGRMNCDFRQPVVAAAAAQTIPANRLRARRLGRSLGIGRPLQTIKRGSTNPSLRLPRGIAG